MAPQYNVDEKASLENFPGISSRLASHSSSYRCCNDSGSCRTAIRTSRFETKSAQSEHSLATKLPTMPSARLTKSSRGVTQSPECQWRLQTLGKHGLRLQSLGIGAYVGDLPLVDQHFPSDFSASQLPRISSIWGKGFRRLGRFAGVHQHLRARLLRRLRTLTRPLFLGWKGAGFWNLRRSYRKSI